MSMVAEKRFDVSGKISAGRIVVNAPMPDGEVWRCQIEISWPRFQRSSYAMGADSWQALELAMRRAATEVFAHPDFESGRIGAFGATFSTYQELTEWLGVRPFKVLEQ